MWFTKYKNKVVIQVDVKNELYIVSRIMPHPQDVREVAFICTPTSSNTNFQNNITLGTCAEGNTNINYRTCCNTELTIGESELFYEDGREVLKFCNTTYTIPQPIKSDYYEPMHRSFDHMGPDQLKNTYEVKKIEKINIGYSRQKHLQSF